jgi:hypothetical protein
MVDLHLAYPIDVLPPVVQSHEQAGGGQKNHRSSMDVIQGKNFGLIYLAPPEPWTWIA